MPKKRVTFRLTEGWETWVVETPEGATDDEIRAGAWTEFVTLDDSGNSGMTAELVEEMDD